MERHWGESAVVFKPTEKARVPGEEAESGRVTAVGTEEELIDPVKSWAIYEDFCFYPKLEGFEQKIDVVYISKWSQVLYWE